MNENMGMKRMWKRKLSEVKRSKWKLMEVNGSYGKLWEVIVKDGMTCIDNFQIFKFSHFQIILFLFFVPFAQAQILTPLNNEMNRRVEHEMNRLGTRFFTVLKPYYDTQLRGNARQDSSDIFYPLNHPKGGLRNMQVPVNYPKLSTHFQIDSSSNFQINSSSSPSWLKRKLLYESFIQVDSGDFYLFADPVFEFSIGKDNIGRNTYINTRGFSAGGRLGKYFAFGTDFYENQALFPSVFDAQLRNTNLQIGSTQIISGQGRGRVKGNVWDYASSSGYVSFSPIEKLNIQLGHGKHFIGDGYRSLLLSDAAYNYPYANATWLWGNFMYSWMLGLTQNLGITVAGSDKEPFKREIIAVHLLSVNVATHFQLSLIQCDMYNNPDTFGNFKSNLELYNPLFMPTSGDRNKHSLWGVNLKIKVSKDICIYHQLTIDNLFGKADKRFAAQAGFKYFDVVGIEGLYLQAEYNQIAPYTYSSRERTLQWMQYGEPLAHPNGHNIKEGIIDISYSRKRWQIENLTKLVRPAKNLTAYNDIIKPGLLYYITGQKKSSNDLRVNYYLNTKTLMHFSVGIVYQKEELAGNAISSNYVYFAFRTALRNVYY